MTLNRPGTIACAILSITGGLKAQTPVAEPAELTRLRSVFEDRLRTVAVPLARAYEQPFAALESSLAAAGDYERARVAKERRAALAAISAGSASTTDAATVALPGTTARTYGAVSSRDGELQGWRTASCAADWTLTQGKFTPGPYQIVLTYSMKRRELDPASPKRPSDAGTPAENASYSLREVSLLAAASRNVCSIPLASTAAVASGWQQLTVPGSIELNRAPVTLRLAPSQSYPNNVISFKDIRLVPVAKVQADPANTSAAPVSLMSELGKLRDAFPDKLKQARAPVIDAYVQRLESALAAAGGDDAIADAIENEKRRAQRIRTDTRLKPESGTRLENFDELADARFVPDPGNTGDTFKIEHEGKTIRIRLAFVTCPPLDPADTKPMKRVLDAFKISPDEALMLARNAQQFTALYLEGRPLQVLVRHTRKSSDAAVALVILEDIGLFQGVLIDHGLAVLDAPGSEAQSKMSDAEAAHFKSLRTREDKARTATPRPGGWGISTAAGSTK